VRFFEAASRIQCDHLAEDRASNCPEKFFINSLSIWSADYERKLDVTPELRGGVSRGNQ
jgi:hypothetical protein